METLLCERAQYNYFLSNFILLLIILVCILQGCTTEKLVANDQKVKRNSLTDLKISPKIYNIDTDGEKWKEWKQIYGINTPTNTSGNRSETSTTTSSAVKLKKMSAASNASHHLLNNTSAHSNLKKINDFHGIKSLNSNKSSNTMLFDKQNIKISKIKKDNIIALPPIRDKKNLQSPTHIDIERQNRVNDLKNGFSNSKFYQ